MTAFHLLVSVKWVRPCIIVLTNQTKNLSGDFTNAYDTVDHHMSFTGNSSQMKSVIGMILKGKANIWNTGIPPAREKLVLAEI